jgi:anti-sigma B factor antagonist
MTLADLDSELDRGVGIAHLSGEIDASNRDEVFERLLGVLRNADWGLVLDLTELRYVDSAGIDMILRLRQRLSSRQQRLRVVAPPSRFVAEVLETVRIAELVPVDTTVAEAVDVLSERLKPPSRVPRPYHR